MKHILIRTGIDVFKYTFQDLEAKFPPSSIISVTSQNYMEKLKKLSMRPMFSKKYLVYVTLIDNSRETITAVTTLSNLKWVKLIVQTNNSDVFLELMGSLDSARWLIVNSYETSDELKEEYLRRELLALNCEPKYITDYKLKLIRRRLRYQEHKASLYLPTLASSPMTIKLIESTIPLYSGVTVSNIGRVFFEKSKHARVANLVYRYRYYIKNIYRNISDYIDTWLALYEQYITGNLNESTIDNWIVKNGKQYKIKYNYQVQQFLDSFLKISADMMILIKMQLAEHSTDSSYNKTILLIRLMNLISKTA